MPDLATWSRELDPVLPAIHLFFFNVPATPKIYTLSLHDALPIYLSERQRQVFAALLTLHGRSARPIGSETLAQLGRAEDRKSTRLNSSHVSISYAVFCLKKKTSA